MSHSDQGISDYAHDEAPGILLSAQKQRNQSIIFEGIGRLAGTGVGLTGRRVRWHNQRWNAARDAGSRRYDSTGTRPGRLRSAWRRSDWCAR